MTDDRGVVRRISWRDVFPWLILLRTFRLAVSPSLLLLATAGLGLSTIGWRLAPYVFFTEKGREQAGISENVFATGEIPQSKFVGTLEARIPDAIRNYFPSQPTAIERAYFRLSEPVARLFRRELTINEVAYYSFGSLWSLAVWAFVGGFITRRAVVQLGTEDAPGLLETTRFVAKRYLWYVLAPLYPLLGVLLLALPIALLGLPLRITELGGVLAGGLWIFVVLAGLIAAWLLVGLLLGWPLMWSTISAEREGDAFEAFSRSFSYVYGRPLHYLFYAVIAAMIGALALAVIAIISQVATDFGFWALSWGAGREQADKFRELAFTGQTADNVGRPLIFGGWLASWALRLVTLVVEGFSYSFFWCVAAAIYLLLRQDVDDKELDEVYLPDDEPPPPAGTAPVPAQPTTSESTPPT